MIIWGGKIHVFFGFPSKGASINSMMPYFEKFWSHTHTHPWRRMTRHASRVTIEIIIFEVVMRHAFWRVTIFSRAKKNLEFSSLNCMYSYKNVILLIFGVFWIDFRAKVVGIDGFYSNFSPSNSATRGDLSRDAKRCDTRHAWRTKTSRDVSWRVIRISRPSHTPSLLRTTHHAIYGCPLLRELV